MVVIPPSARPVLGVCGCGAETGGRRVWSRAEARNSSRRGCASATIAALCLSLVFLLIFSCFSRFLLYSSQFLILPLSTAVFGWRCKKFHPRKSCMHGVLNDVYYLPLPTNTVVVPTQDPNAQFAKFYLANLVFCQLLKRYAV
jgi:hypothetical protein